MELKKVHQYADAYSITFEDVTYQNVNYEVNYHKVWIS